MKFVISILAQSTNIGYLFGNDFNFFSKTLFVQIILRFSDCPLALGFLPSLTSSLETNLLYIVFWLESLTRIICSSSSIIDHILASFPDRVTQQGTLNVGLSDQQLIYCTRKFTRIKRGGHKQITYLSFKNHTIDGYEKVLVEINFPEYKKFGNVNDAYSNFIQKLMEVIDKVAPVKSKRIKRNSQEWFDSEISEKLIIRDKLFKKYKKTRLHVDKEIYKRAQYSVQNLTAKKENNFLKTNSKSVLVNLKTYGKLLNHSDYLINLVNV